MKKYVLPLVLLITATVICSCSTMTKISGTWTKPGYTGTKFNKILVVAISNDITKRNSVEASVKGSLTYYKMNATTSEKIIDFSKVDKNNNGKIDSTKRDEVLKMIRNGGYDGALVISLLDIKERTQYIPGETYYQPSYYGAYGAGNYDGFYGYSYTTYEVVTTPGYFKQTKKIYIESRLFDLSKDELLWSARSVTANPLDINDFSKSLANTIVKALLKDAAIK
jgi:hypothetical protein